jgi:hypothetical protein
MLRLPTTMAVCVRMAIERPRAARSRAIAAHG